MGDGKILHLMANLSDRDLAASPNKAKGTLIWGNELKGSMPPSIIKAWAVSWRIG
jgi:maltooligosyltrehalose trehalohydrolase